MIKKHSLKLIFEDVNTIDRHFSSHDQLIKEGPWDWVRTQFYKHTGNESEAEIKVAYLNRIKALSKSYPEFFRKLQSNESLSKEQISDLKTAASGFYKSLANEKTLSGQTRNELISFLRTAFIKAITQRSGIEGKRAPRSTEIGKQAQADVATLSQEDLQSEQDLLRLSILETLLQSFKDVDPALTAVAGSGKEKDQAGKKSVGEQAPSAPPDADIQKVYESQGLSSTLSRIRTKNLLKTLTSMKQDLEEDEDKELDLKTLTNSIQNFNGQFPEKIRKKAAEKIVEILANYFNVEVEENPAENTDENSDDVLGAPV